MIRPERAVGAGARAPSRPRTIRWLTAMLATLIAVAGLVIMPAPQAGATEATNVPYEERCHLFASFLGIPAVDEETFATNSRTVTGPGVIERGETGQFRIESPWHILPNTLEGATVNNLNNISDTFRVSPDLEIIGVTFQGGTLGPGNVNISGQQVTVTWPGPYPPQVFHEPPDTVIEVRATGTVGTVGTIELLQHRWQASVTQVVIFPITVQAAMTCTPAPGIPAPPNGIIRSIPTVPGPYEQPAVAQATVNTTCSFNFNGTASNNQPINVPFTINPGNGGGSVEATIQPGPFNWQGTADGFTASNRRVTLVRNVGFTIDVDDYDVVDVSTSGSATVSYDSGTGLVTYNSFPGSGTGTGGAVSGTQTPPAIQVTLEPVGSDPSFAVVGHQFDYRTETSGLFGSWGSAAWRTTVCNVTETELPLSLDLPVAADLSVTVDNISSVDIGVIAASTAGENPSDPASVYVFDGPQHGTISLNPATGVLTYTPTLGILETSDSFKYLFNDVEGYASTVGTVNITIVGLYCVAGQPGVDAHGCALDQFIEFDVEGDPLTLAQDASSVLLDTITLDGEPQPTSGLLNELTVTNQRGDGQLWSVTGQVTDFKEDEEAPNCPASVPSSWYYKCIPGDNLGWAPVAAVEHDQVPGDVATVDPGSTIESGLSSEAQTLCITAIETSGGTFTCGAVLTLITPASAAAQVYKATLTLTLA